MKLVREYINEKFTEDSDPIEDMNIGMMHEIKKWVDEHHYETFNYNLEDILIICVDYKKYEYVKYLLDKGVNIHTGGSYHNYENMDLPIRYAIFDNDLKMTKFLLKYDASIRNAFSEMTSFKDFNKKMSIYKKSKTKKQILDLVKSAFEE